MYEGLIKIPARTDVKCLLLLCNYIKREPFHSLLVSVYIFITLIFCCTQISAHNFIRISKNKNNIFLHSQSQFILWYYYESTNLLFNNKTLKHAGFFSKFCFTFNVTNIQLLQSSNAQNCIKGASLEFQKLALSRLKHKPCKSIHVLLRCMLLTANRNTLYVNLQRVAININPGYEYHIVKLSHPICHKGG